MRSTNPETAAGETQHHGMLAPLDVVNFAYIAVVVVVTLCCRRRIPLWAATLTVYVALAAALLVFLWFAARTRHPFIRFARVWYTAPLFLLHYELAVTLNQALAPLYAPWIERWAPGGSFVAANLGDRVYFDPLMMALDEWLFGFQPSIRFAHAVPAAWFGEIMNFAYLSFYIFIPVVGFTLWFSGRRRACGDMLFRATFTMLACCVLFIPFPIAGPRHFLAPETMNLDNGYVCAWVMGHLFEHADVPNGGFPSSHVALAASVLLSAAVYDRRVFALLAPLFGGLCVATVYVAGHYVVDTLAGLVAGPVFYVAAVPVRSALSRWLDRARGVRSGRAARNGEALGA